jgi:hypothetical protein
MLRRNFIVLSTFAAAAVSLPLLKCTSADPELDKKLAIPETLSQLIDENSIKEIGKKYGSSNPNDYSANTLERELKKEIGGKSVTSGTSLNEIYSLLDKNIQNDFESANTLVISGWVLSATEAKQCALFSLINNSK